MLVERGERMTFEEAIEFALNQLKLLRSYYGTDTFHRQLNQAISTIEKHKKDYKEEEVKDCKSCEYCDLSNNTCYQDGCRCYDKNGMIKKECNKYEEGKWCVKD